MKKALSMLLAMGLVVSMAVGCGSNSGSTETSASKETSAASTEGASAEGAATDAAGDTDAAETASAAKADTDRVYKIGVCQLVQHDALDAAYEGFVEGLKEAGYVDGENIQIDYQNAQGDQSNCSTIASKLVNDQSDLILAIATPAAQACANATEQIPIVLTAVTDPAASGLVESNEAPGANITGTSDLTPVKEQMDLLKEMLPDAKKIAILYCSSETNSKIQADMAKEAAKAIGLETQDATVSNSNEIQQVVQNLVGKVDAIYAPTDNMIAAGMQTVSMVANPAGIPIICGEEGMVNNGGLATRGINYFNLGKQTGAQAAKILAGESDPAAMPIEYLKDVDTVINKDAAEELGLEIPADLQEFVKTPAATTEASSEETSATEE
ncbi:ABC transporter substrate-binding protein [Robinsoniella sp. KNHs210]|uniref:ABC transporter substrate-binding protein n=1 Tax=Robinsoniella sp. KNHs210 TaxID=1469950 RepID=UPI0007C866BB|nr:ABC transporter substrate-binding protein [Robinsoniella sp. KNHs210]